MENIKEFKKSDWNLERSNDWTKFDRYRNVNTNEVIKSYEFNDKIKAHKRYFKDFDLLFSFKNSEFEIDNIEDIEMFLDERYTDE